MSWKDRLRPASFRGVAFHADAAEYEFGRRAVVHDLPLRDGGIPEDLGAAPRAFRVTGFVLGDDYDQARDALIAALMQEGPGALLHPWRGEIRVQSGRVKMQETRGEGGIARFDMEFFEAPLRTVAPVSSVASDAVVTQSALVVDQSAAATFEAEYDPAGLPAYAADGSAESVRQATVIANAIGGAVTADSWLQAAGALAPLADQVAAGFPASHILSVVTRLYGAMTSVMQPWSLSRDLGAMAGLGYLPAPAATPVYARMERQGALLSGLFRQGALTTRARAQAALDYPSFDAAEAARAGLVADIAAERQRAAGLGHDDIYRALGGLQASVTRDSRTRSRDLARLVDYDVGPGPSLVIAHRLWRDARRADDLAQGAALWHPAFLPGRGRALSA